MDIAMSIQRGEVTRQEVVDSLTEMQVIEAVQQESEKVAEVECTIYVTHVGGIRKVRDDCRRLKYLFDALKIRYNEIDIAENKWLRAKITKASGEDSLPLVFVKETFVGTYDHLERWNDDGVLRAKLEEKGYV